MLDTGDDELCGAAHCTVPRLLKTIRDADARLYAITAGKNATDTVVDAYQLRV